MMFSGNYLISSRARERLDAKRFPEWMQTDEMRQAMNTLKAFSEKEHAYDACDAYQGTPELTVRVRFHRTLSSSLAS
jgi:hypothetical protein